jgi:hypothetical protein
MEQLKEALKEAARLVLLAVVPIVLMGVDLPQHAVRIDWSFVELTALVTALRFLDAWLHEKGKADGNDTMSKGLTQF